MKRVLVEPEHRLGALRGSFGILIGAIVALLSLVILVASRTGVPVAVTNVPFLGQWLTRSIGIRLVLDYPNGRTASREVFRGQGQVYDYRVVAHETPQGELPPLVKGVYFSPEGKAVARVKDGTGIHVMFYTNGTPYELTFYADGLACGPVLRWSMNGELACSRFVTAPGFPIARTYYFHRDGGLHREMAAFDGIRYRVEKHWATNGTLELSRLWDDKSSCYRSVVPPTPIFSDKGQRLEASRPTNCCRPH
jgi:hypothetical protein